MTTCRTAIRADGGPDPAPGIDPASPPPVVEIGRWPAEWQQWLTRPDAASAPRRWARRHRCLAGLTTLPEVLAGCGQDRRVPEEVADARLAAVVSEARRGDRVATRLVLERVLPGLINHAVRRAGQLGRSPGEALADMAANAWLVIAEYPLERRPRKIAVNIICDAAFRTCPYVPVVHRCTDLSPREELPDRVAGIDGRPCDAPALPGAELLEVLADAVAAGFPRSEAQLLAELYALGFSVEDCAARRGVGGRRIRTRRREALAALASWLATCPPSPAAGDPVAASA